MRLNNKIAVITGGARGIGAKTAELFIQEGATVIITDILDAPGQTLANTLGSNAYYYSLDASLETSWQEFSTYLNNTFQRIDILFNNAGIIGLEPTFGPQNPEALSLETWQHLHHVNLESVFLGCKYGIQLMKASGGAIINMSSRSGLVGVPAAAAYASTKAAIRNYTKSVALYCASAQYAIRCNSVLPGAILTPLWDPMLGKNTKTKAQAIADISANIPLGHMGTPEDVAYAVVYLGSDEAKYITGTEIIIDGGILAGSTAAPKPHTQ